MDVTCERCATEYEFDDALVSEKGTTVKCTHCGHQFKVRRTDGVRAPERWVVRTLDGREVEFRALRELQSAIAQVRVTRDDVLSRGTSRPRRLGSIAELEPFFATAGSSINAPRPSSYPSSLKSTVIGVGPRERSTTPPGLGAPPLARADAASASAGASTNEETSVAFALPRAWVAFPPTDVESTTEDSPSTDRDPETTDRKRTVVDVGPPMMEESTAPREDDPVTARRIVGQKGSVPPSPMSEDCTQPFKRAPVLDGLASTVAKSPAPSEAAASAGSASAVDAPVSSSSEGAESSSDFQKTQRMEAVSTNGAAPSSNGSASSGARPAQPPPPPPPSPSFGLPPVASGPPSSDNEPITHPRRPTLPVDSKPRVAGADEADEGRESSEPPMAVGRPSLISSPTTPTPSEVRVSYMMSGGEESMSEPRFSSAAISRSSGGVKLIVALMVGGAVIFLAVLFGRRFLTTDGPAPAAAAASDERVSELLSEGVRQMEEGDLLAAKEQLDKASALAEQDPRVALALAKLAVAHAEIPWLRLRLLEHNDPDRDAAKRELAYAIVRVDNSVKRAQELAPSEADVTRAAIDAKRLAGERDAARELVKTLPGGAHSEDNAFALGALDLAEDQPPWPTVVDRLTKAAAAEKNLGRARALLVYALARSKEVDRARAEYERLQSLPRAHPLLGPFRSFLDRAEKGDVEPVDVDSLPDVGDEEGPEPPVAGGTDPSGVSDIITEAHAAHAKGNLDKAEELYVQALTKNAANTEAQAGLADIARARGQADKASALYQKVLNANPNYLPAMVALADMKWSTGDQTGAKALYTKILQQVSSGPIADKARERLGQSGAPPTGPTPPPAAPPVPTPTPSGPVPNDYVSPDQPTIDTTDFPGHPSDVDEHI